MNIRRYFNLIFLILFSISNLIAQDSIRTEAEFRSQEPDILEKILWLEENPISTTTNDTKVMTEFVLDWLANTPYITVTYDEVFLEGISNNKYKFIEKFRVTYLFGKSYYTITHVDEYNEVNASTRGIVGMVKVYSELKRVDPSVKHRLLEKYTRLLRTEKLNIYVRNKLLSNEEEELNFPEPY